ncbi:MAG: hypothetical protein FWE70_04455, partial [Oscillospiraceae bacterium]|nr:hypothetical protein [Oscillospiraceae bacterium]
ELAIDGIDDGVVTHGLRWSGLVYGEEYIPSTFRLAEVAEEQDPLQRHPSVLAEVRVGGRPALFGLGIDPKAPVAVSLVEKRRLAKPGARMDVFINVRNNLPADAELTFSLPRNSLTRFDESRFTLALTKGKDRTVRTGAEVLGCGHRALAVRYKVRLAGGGGVAFTRPLHLVNQGTDGTFAFETEDSRGCACGIWRLQLSRKDNSASFHHALGGQRAGFPVGRLGKPFDDEFNLMKPVRFTVRRKGGGAEVEAAFASGRFPGIALTERYEVSPSGTVAKTQVVTNMADAVADMHVRAGINSDVGSRAVLHHGGEVHAVCDDLGYGFSDLPAEGIDENWVFEDGKGHKAGICWPLGLKPKVQWGNMLSFETPTGPLRAGASFAAGPFTYAGGAFENFWDFRNHAMGLYSEETPKKRNHLELIVNGGNPFLTYGPDPGKATLSLLLRNNRQKKYKGAFTFSSPDGILGEVTMEDDGDSAFDRKEAQPPLDMGAVAPGAYRVSLAIKAAGYEGLLERAVVACRGDAEVRLGSLGGGAGSDDHPYGETLTAENGGVRLSVTPGHSDALRSLTHSGREWLHSGYPRLEPYYWWNPYVGGLQTVPERMSYGNVLREDIRARHVGMADSMGGDWRGIAAEVRIGVMDHHKGMGYVNYYLTKPDAPVICHFTEVRNQTGTYRHLAMETGIFLSGREGLSDVTASFAGEDGADQIRRMGEELWQGFKGLITMARGLGTDGGGMMHIFKDAARDGGNGRVSGDISSASVHYVSHTRTEDGGVYRTRPIFIVFSDKKLRHDSLDDLSNVHFN